MATEVILTSEATKELAELKNAVILARIAVLIKRLEQWPTVSGAKPLRGDLAGFYRMRTGDYRLQFRVETRAVVNPTTQAEESQVRVVITKVGHRDGFYDD